MTVSTPQLADLHLQLLFDTLLAALDLDLLSADERLIAWRHVLPALATMYDGDDELILAWGSGTRCESESRLRALLRLRLNLDDGPLVDEIITHCLAERPPRPFDPSLVRHPLLAPLVTKLVARQGGQDVGPPWIPIGE